MELTNQYIYFQTILKDVQQIQSVNCQTEIVKSFTHSNNTEYNFYYWMLSHGYFQPIHTDSWLQAEYYITQSIVSNSSQIRWIH
jgi:hypothetical protein